MGSLLVISPGFVIALGCLAAVAWASGGWLRHRRAAHRRAWRVVLVVLATVLTLLTGADAVNAYYGYLPRLDDVLGVQTWPTAPYAQVTSASTTPTGEHRRGAVVVMPLPGRVSGFGLHVGLVYLPPQYFTDSSARFPVVYLLHGSPGAPVDWFRANRAADVAARLAGEGRPVILVAPLMSRGWLDDSECVDRPTEHVETYLVNDVIPAVDAALRTVPRRDDRILVGNSAGGFCALNIGLRHRSLFGTLVVLSGFARPTHDGGMAGLFGHRPDLPALAAANDPSRYAATLSPSPAMRVWFDCGRGDTESLRDELALAPVLRRKGFTVVVRQRPGGHDYGVWRPALRDGLGWAVVAPAASSAVATT